MEPRRRTRQRRSGGGLLLGGLACAGAVYLFSPDRSHALARAGIATVIWMVITAFTLRYVADATDGALREHLARRRRERRERRERRGVS